MSWRGALACWAVALALALAFWLSGEAPPEAISGSPLEPTAAVSPARLAYELTRDSIAAVEVQRGDQVLRWIPAGTGWQVVQPAGAHIAAGALDAFVDQLVDGAANERLDGASLRAEQIGLHPPAWRIRVERADGSILTLSIGERTPTATALYGRVEETGTLFVAGLSFHTYAELLFGALR